MPRLGRREPDYFFFLLLLRDELPPTFDADRLAEERPVDRLLPERLLERELDEPPEDERVLERPLERLAEPFDDARALVPRRLPRAGTLAPRSRASDRPIAIACLRLFTFEPLPPLRSVPCCISCIARCTFSWAD